MPASCKRTRPRHGWLDWKANPPLKLTSPVWGIRHLKDAPLARNTRSRQHSVTHLNAYSCQAAKLSESDLPMRQVTWAEGLKLVNDGKAEWEFGRAGIKGIRFKERQRLQNPTPCTLDLRVMKSVSGEGLAGPHSLGTNGGQEDALCIKFAVWAYVGDTKAVCVRPKVDEAYRQRAEKLLAA